jgi:hypothetical protein
MCLVLPKWAHPMRFWTAETRFFNTTEHVEFAVRR